jgi:NTE family protein
MPFRRHLLLLLAMLTLGGCFGHSKPIHPAAPDPVIPPLVPVKLKIGLALGGGAAKGFAHIGVIKMLEASGIHPDVVAGTSAGSVVGALYASGMDAFQLQEPRSAWMNRRSATCTFFPADWCRARRCRITSTSWYATGRSSN